VAPAVMLLWPLNLNRRRRPQAESVLQLGEVDEHVLVHRGVEHEAAMFRIVGRRTRQDRGFRNRGLGRRSADTSRGIGWCYER